MDITASPLAIAPNPGTEQQFIFVSAGGPSDRLSTRRHPRFHHLEQHLAEVSIRRATSGTGDLP